VALRVGAGVEVYGSVLQARGRWVTCLRSMVACSEARVEAVKCSKAGDNAATCFGVGIEDGRRRHDSV
jgi:hypothetical protein